MHGPRASDCSSTPSDPDRRRPTVARQVCDDGPTGDRWVRRARCAIGLRSARYGRSADDEVSGRRCREGVGRPGSADAERGTDAATHSTERSGCRNHHGRPPFGLELFGSLAFATLEHYPQDIPERKPFPHILPELHSRIPGPRPAHTTTARYRTGTGPSSGCPCGRCRYSAACSATVAVRVSPATSIRTVSPAPAAPSTTRVAMRSSTSRWMRRRSGRAPYSGS